MFLCFLGMPFGGLSAHGYQLAGPLAHAMHMSNLHQQQQQQQQQPQPQQSQQPSQQPPQQSTDQEQSGM